MICLFLLLLFFVSSTADLIWTTTFDCSRINTIFCCTSRVRSFCTEQCQGVPCGPKYYQNLFSTNANSGGVAEMAKDGDTKIISTDFDLSSGVSDGNSGRFETDQITLVERTDSVTSLPYLSSTSFMQSLPFLHFSTEQSLHNQQPPFTPPTPFQSIQPSLSTVFPTLIPFDSISFGSDASVTTESSPDWPEITTTKPLRRRTTPDPRIIKPPESLVIIGDYDQDELSFENAIDLMIPEESHQNSGITNNRSGIIMPISSINKEELSPSIDSLPHFDASEQKRRPNWSISILPHTENSDANKETIPRVPNLTIDGEAGRIEKKDEVQSVIDTVINSFSFTSRIQENTKEDDKMKTITSFVPSSHKETLEVISSGTASVIPVIRTTLPSPTTTSLLLPYRSSLPGSDSEFSSQFSIHRAPQPVSPSIHSQINQQCGVAPNFIPCVSSRKASEALLTCCQQKNLPTGCLRLCRYDITQAEVRTAIDRGQCGIFNVAPFLECATQGKDNSECCRYKGVATKSGPQCEQFCRPSVGLTPLGLQHIVCGNAIGEMLQCHHSGIRE